MADYRTPEWHRAHPIFKTDFTLPLDQIIETIRSDLAELRGKLSDVSHGYPGYAERFSTAQEGMTLIISYLYGVKKEIDEVQKRQAEAEKDNG